ncbi:MAG: pyruvate formate lyase family protein [Anaerolineaceae bacterium]|jgi:formate C-acetyltransferase
MNERLEELKRRTRNGEQKAFRRLEPISVLEECEAENLSWPKRVARLMVRQCEAETVVIGTDEQIVFTRTVPAAIPELYSPADWARITAGRTLHESGPINNLSPDWDMVLSQGLLDRKQAALASRKKNCNDPEAVEFLDCAIESIDAVLALAGSYAAEAHRLRRIDLAEMLEQVPAYAPRTFHEALQSLRLLQAVIWLTGHYQVGLGRLDQYLWPYLKADLDSGRLDKSEAYDLLAEFFISLNKDSDLYPGVQQGDNGQTITLGGVTPDGQSAVNELTYLALQASRDVSMIDPKVNLRISADTDLELLSLATELTRKGLGFPQYSNDDVVIPALVAHGYRLEDAREYAVAACWEFLIPGKGMEVVNIGAVSFPAAVDAAIRAGLPAGEDIPGILRRVRAEIDAQVKHLAGDYEKLLLPPAPFFSVLMDDCVERGKDLSAGARYNNFGIHGAGSANAADALAAVQELVFIQHSLEPADLLAALDTDFQGREELRLALEQQAPKVGNDDERADGFMVKLLDMLADACEGYGKTSRGGILRPGSGSAMYYIWLTQSAPGMREPVVGATAEGRHKGKPLAANLAPTQGVQVRGPISVLLSFSKIDYRRICNGGPITLELSDSIFRDAESVHKVAMLVRAFAQQGCQQLQVNSMNLATLLDAKAHPELHKNLIVRVWGWSGYFCELSPEYQDQVIARHIYTAE